MNLSRLFALVGSATLFLIPGTGFGALSADSSAIGQDIVGPALAPPDHEPRPMTPQEQEVLKRFDQNQDGKLDADEAAYAQGQMQKQRQVKEIAMRRLYDQLLARFDKAHTGKLDADEQVQALEFLKTSHAQAYQGFLRQYDRNNDGKLDANETAAMFQYLAYLPATLTRPKATPAAANKMAPAAQAAAQNPQRAQISRLYSRLLESFDHEHKGSLTPAEQSEAVTYIKGNNPEVYDRMLQRFDEDGDGKLSPAETQKMFDTLSRLSAEQPAAPQAVSAN